MTGTVHLHVLLAGVQTDRLALAADVVDLVAVFLYLTGVRRLAARGRRWSPPATAAFITGIACIWLAVGSGLAGYDDLNATIHMIQHALLMMVAAPLVAMGKPITLASQATRRPTQMRILRLVHSRSAMNLTNPVTGWFLYYGAMYACFLDRRVYHFLLIHPLAHDGSHVLLVMIGYLYWQPLIGGDPTRRRLAHRARMTSTLTGTTAECILGVAIVSFRRPFDPINTLGDTHAAGAALVVLALVTCGLCATVMAGQSRRRPTGGRSRSRSAVGAMISTELA
jgi:cytochrome c oxidase assembly factor CtaG